MVPVTPESVSAVYEMLIQLPPFVKWGMPPVTKVNFAVEPLVSMWGDYDPRSKTIRISSAKVSTFTNLVLAVAHESCHVKQDFSNRWPVKDPHNAYFKKLASQVCRTYDFDERNF